MTPKPLSDQLSVTAQPPLDAMAEAATQDFKAVISNRPDGEEEGQPSAAQMAQAAEEAGLTFTHIPVVPGQYGEADIAAFKAALDKANGPVLAFCKSGMRAASLWALSQAGTQPAEALLAAAQSAGFDLTALKDRLETV